jgi:hypothetical protein
MRRMDICISSWVLFFVATASPLSAVDSSPAGTVGVVLFYSGESGESLGIVEGFLPSLREVYTLEVRLLDVDDPENLSILVAFEERYGVEGDVLPVVFVGEEVLSGPDAIRENLETLVARCEAKGGCPLPEMPEAERGEARVLSHPVYIAIFYESGCAGCDRVRFLIDGLGERYSGLAIREIDIETTEGKLLNETLCERIGVAEADRLTTPSVFFTGDALIGDKITRSSLEDLIEKYEMLEGTVPPWDVAEGERIEAEGRIVERFKALGLSTVAAAGLLDGVNPCAFATLIFFLSYLSVVGRKRREILLVGIAFSASVFVTYFFVGLGFLRVIQSVSVIPLVGRCVYGVAIGVAVVFGGVNLYDYVLCRRGRISEMVLQMPVFLKDRVRGVIRKEARVNRYIVAALATGFAVSILELACTGQVYLPTILFVSRADEFRASAIGCLLVYNLMFIVPLLGIFGLVYFGTGSDRLTTFFQNNVSWVKLATSVFFFVLAGAMALSFF